MGWCENKQGACCASTRCGQQMLFSWPQPWCGVREDPIHHAFICLDQRLREAARREGFHILPRR